MFSSLIKEIVYVDDSASKLMTKLIIFHIDVCIKRQIIIALDVQLEQSLLN
jgi:hypothetical protein